MQSANLKGIVAHDEFAEVADAISSADWAFYTYTDDIANLISDYMQQHGISKAALAEKAGVSKARISTALRGDANLTFKAFTKILDALEAKPVTRIVEKHEEVVWHCTARLDTGKVEQRIISLDVQKNRKAQSTSVTSLLLDNRNTKDYGVEIPPLRHKYYEFCTSSTSSN